MRMQSKRILSIMLSLLLMISLMGSTLAAAAENTYPDDYENYHFMIFGDSYSRGMGCSDTWVEDTQIEYRYGDHQTRCVKDAFPTLVAQALACRMSDNNYLEEKDSTFWPMIHKRKDGLFGLSHVHKE